MLSFEYMRQYLDNIKQYGKTIDDVINEMEADIERFSREIEKGNNVEAFTKEREMFISNLHSWYRYKQFMKL